jgi:hypothetical protein
LGVVRQLLAQIDDRPDSPSLDQALAKAHARLSAYLDLGTPAPQDAVDTTPQRLDMLPEHPPAHDLVPWLSRRLALTVHDAARLRAAADSAPPRDATSIDGR